MSSAVPRRLQPSASLRIEEELMDSERQGIGSILGFSSAAERQRAERRESLRRTFSADMSSQKWLLAQNIPLSLRKIASTEEFPTMSFTDTSSPYSSSSSSASEDEEEKEERSKKELERPGQFDIWSSIQSQKTTNSDSLFNTPYIHPLVKRSSSSLSEKSLEICTESLGSETGSVGFSSSGDEGYFPSDESDEIEEENEEVVVQEQMQDEKEELGAVNYNCSISRKSPTNSFPPPLPSIFRGDGSCLQMRTHREHGRLVVEAVPVPSHNYLHAQRQDGRLLLSFISSPSEREAHITSKQEEEETEKEEEEEEAEEEEFEEEEIEEVVVDRGIELEAKVKQEEVMSVHQPTLAVMNKIMAGMHAMHLNNPNPWVGKTLNDRDEARRVSPILATAAFNGYDRCWKSCTMAHPAAQPPLNKLIVSKKPALVLKAEDFLPVMRCMVMEPRRPVFVWEPFCIATT